MAVLKLTAYFTDGSDNTILLENGQNEYDLTHCGDRQTLVFSHYLNENENNLLINNNNLYHFMTKIPKDLSTINNIKVEFLATFGWVTVIDLSILNVQIDKINYVNTLKRMSQLLRPVEEIRISLKDKEEK